ncbi:chorismate synthase [Acetobacterium woodii]|uniref:Chorismate synthase n=1 Tax=Acetobacterium woodii (strain ATCC 29683 / DSM 1030 / JCM 2381 / KCTC 1655 / WB1) TaxID=931626 RepID=H6LET2_ACEWD|nr:chorismate synthase [Acetobacterium woodii]AFA49375.1 chorismate synthase AroC [Acetobacterium woodii DSM 1030]
MGSTWGNKFKISIFGESHGNGIGAVIDGLPAGIAINPEHIQHELNRRAARGNPLATPRKEGDQIEILSGVFNGKTTGAPLAGLIRNENTRSGDYAKTKDLMRPGHADYTSNIRYGGFQDYRGGGHFSGRLTAPLVFAGAIAKEILRAISPQMEIGSRIVAIADVKDKAINDWRVYCHLKNDFINPAFPLYDAKLEVAMKAAIISAMEDEDSVGGIVEGFITGSLPGIGNPFFESIESRLAALLFSIPAVKGVTFGAGFETASKRGSEVNDALRMRDGKIETVTNNNGGINGGISNGMPIVFQVAFKPTPSIGKEQQTINIAALKDATLKIEGRHDPCIVVRAFPVVEAVTAICMADFLLR